MSRLVLSHNRRSTAKQPRAQKKTRAATGSSPPPHQPTAAKNRTPNPETIANRVCAPVSLASRRHPGRRALIPVFGRAEPRKKQHLTQVMVGRRRQSRARKSGQGLGRSKPLGAPIPAEAKPTARKSVCARGRNLGRSFDNRNLMAASAPTQVVLPPEPPRSRERWVAVICLGNRGWVATNPSRTYHAKRARLRLPKTATSSVSNGVRCFPRPHSGVSPDLPRCQRSPSQTPNPAGGRSDLNGAYG